MISKRTIFVDKHPTHKLNYITDQFCNTPQLSTTLAYDPEIDNCSWKEVYNLMRVKVV